MTAEYLQSSPATSQEKEWVVVNTNRNAASREVLASKPETKETKLLFNKAIPTCVSNRATRVHPPTSVVIEKLLPLSEEQQIAESAKSSISFTSLSEERLRAAVKLAKKDLHRKRLESLNKSPKHFQKASLLETSDVELLQDLGATPSKVKIKASSPKERVAKPRGRLSAHTAHKTPIPPMSRVGLSPPTTEPGPKQQGPLGQEIHRLQHELKFCIQRAEELANIEEKVQEPLEPNEQRKLDGRRQKQAARSASIIYVLLQQVKEIQENIENAHGPKTKIAKTTILHRLAAAHRGALRALQVFIHQLSDSTCNKPPNFNHLGQLIRQLCLCSAKAGVDKGLAVPQIALDILQKLETLDSALSQQAVQVQACPGESSRRSISPISAPRAPNTLVHQAACKPAKNKKNSRGKKMALQKPRSLYPSTNRRDVLRGGLKGLDQQRVQGEKNGGPLKNTCKKGESQFQKIIPSRKCDQIHNAGFHQPTVSSRLRVNQLPEKEHSVPWIPTSPHSPPRQQSLEQKTRPEPRCLFSPEKTPQRPHNHKVTDMFRAGPSLNSEKKNQAQAEALRRVWLDKMTMQRLKELHQLSKEENERIQLLRSKVISPSQWAERAEQKATERIQPLLDQAQKISESRIASSQNNRLNERAAQRAAESAEQLSETLLEDLLEDTARAAWAVKTDRQLEGMAQRRLQANTLESMLLRMEEIQRDQEEVRRRVASIMYSDLLRWDKPEHTGPQYNAPGSRPSSPQPIRLTRPVVRQSPAADIVLEKPVETGVLMETRQTEEVSQEEQQVMFPLPMQRGRAAVISVPSNTLRSIRQYRADYEVYQSTVAQNSVGGINPWAIADSLAEELLSEALADVAAEFQDVVEEYAEAVFTSEFLQPVQSPPPSVKAIKGQ